MKKFILTLIILIGLYTLLRNNVYKFPDQIMWITSHNIFYEIFIPLLMVISAFWAFVEKRKRNIFVLTVVAMIIDATHRLSIAVNHFYGYLLNKDKPIPPPQEEVTIIIINHWPSHIMLIIEIILIAILLKYLNGKKLYHN